MASLVRKLTRGGLGNGWKLAINGQRSLFSSYADSPKLQVPDVLKSFDVKHQTSDDGAEVNQEMLNHEITKKEIVNPLKHKDFFGVRNLFTLEDLFNARVHLGHKQGLRNPHMLPFIFGNRLGVDIIDLEKTVPLLQDALNFLAHVAYRQGVILFISRHLQMMPLIESTARECGEYAHCRLWKGGSFTNMTVQFGAVTRLPDVCLFVTTQNSVFEQHIAVIEASKVNVPTIGVVDTGCDPRLITYPIPGNDDSPCAIEFYCRLFKQAILKGKEKYAELTSTQQ